MRTDTLISNPGRLAVLLLGLSCAAGAQAAGTVAYTGERPQAVATADFNGDGLPDLAVVNLNNNNVAVLLDTTAPGSASLALASEQSFATGPAPIAVAAADLNGDGKPDLVVADCADDTVAVLINTTVPGSSTVSFAAAQMFATGATPISVAAADLNGDGLPDVITANTSGNTLSVLLNATPLAASTAAFGPEQEFAVGQMPNAVVAVDINGDGLPDLAVSNYGDCTVSVLVNSTANGAGSASFDDPQVFTAGNMPQSMAAGDINRDGRPDLVVVSGNDNTVGVLLNQTAAASPSVAFTAQQTFTAATFSQGVAVQDLNGDGFPEIIVADEAGSTVAVLANTTQPGSATASFVDEQDFNQDVGGGLLAVIGVDLNGDGLPEVIAVNTSDDDVSVLLNGTAPGDTSLDLLQ